MPVIRGSTLLSRLQRAADADLTSLRPFLILSLCFVVLRLPLVLQGFGFEPDAWRVALTGHYLLSHGQYFPSRLPGYPLPELLSLPLLPLGSVATNLETVVVALIGVFLFGRIVRQLGLPQPALLTIGFAFTPALVVESSWTIDYLWAVTCMLGAYYALLRGHILWAGALMGMTMAARLQTGVIWLPLAYLLLRERRPRDLLALTLMAGGVGLVLRAPTFLGYGLRVFSFYDFTLDYQTVARLVLQQGIGVAAAAVILIACLLSWRRLRSLPHDVVADPQVGAWLIMLLAALLVYLRLPDKIGHGVALAPFAFFIMGRYFGRATMAMVVLAIVLCGLVDVSLPPGRLGLTTLKGTSIGRGIVLADYDGRRDETRVVQQTLAAQVPPHSVVLMLQSYPELAVRSWGKLHFDILSRDYKAISMLGDRGETIDQQHDVRYVYAPSYDDYLSLRDQGYKFEVISHDLDGPPTAYEIGPALDRGLANVAASFGMSEVDLAHGLQNGQTLVGLGHARGFSRQQVMGIVRAAVATEMQVAISNKTLSPLQAAVVAALIEPYYDVMVNLPLGPSVHHERLISVRF